MDHLVLYCFLGTLYLRVYTYDIDCKHVWEHVFSSGPGHEPATGLSASSELAIGSTSRTGSDRRWVINKIHDGRYDGVDRGSDWYRFRRLRYIVGVCTKSRCDVTSKTALLTKPAPLTFFLVSWIVLCHCIMAVEHARAKRQHGTIRIELVPAVSIVQVMNF